MKLKIYSVRDSKAEFFGAPFFMQKRGAAIRAFTDLANDGRSQVAKHPEDFGLYEIGEFDDQTGEVVGIAHVALGLASSYVTQKNETGYLPGFSGIDGTEILKVEGK